MRASAVIFDCEFLTAPGAPQRFWCGPYDPDPVVVQIGAVELALTAQADILDRFSVIVHPTLRDGSDAPIHPFFTELTGLTEERIVREGISLQRALHDLGGFAGDAPMWSWGKDEFNMLAISCYVAGIAPSMPASRFGNAARLLLRAGVPADEIGTLRSPGMAAHFGIDAPDLRAHDAASDAENVALTLQYLIHEGRLDPMDLLDPMRPASA